MLTQSDEQRFRSSAKHFTLRHTDDRDLHKQPSQRKSIFEKISFSGQWQDLSVWLRSEISEQRLAATRKRLKDLGG